MCVCVCERERQRERERDRERARKRKRKRARERAIGGGDLVLEGAVEEGGDGVVAEGRKAAGRARGVAPAAREAPQALPAICECPG